MGRFVSWNSQRSLESPSPDYGVRFPTGPLLVLEKTLPKNIVSEITHALVVKWTSQFPCEESLLVRFQPRARIISETIYIFKVRTF